jgi:tetratricopeptide (TPR) repeat protein
MTANLYVREGKLDKAIETWRKPGYLRLREVSSWSYTFYNNPEQMGNVGAQLKSRRLYKEALTELASEAIRTGQLGFASPLYVSALYGSGQREKAVDLLWRKVLDPLGLDTGESYYDYSWRYYQPYWGDGYGYGDESSATALLLRIHAEAGLLPELEVKLTELRKSFPGNESVKSLWLSFLRKSERYADLLDLTTKQLEKSPGNDGQQREMVDLLRKLKRYGDAVPIAEERFTRQRSNVGNSDRTYYSPGASTGSQVRFSWAGTGSRGMGGYSSMSSYSSGASQDLTVAGDLMALYAKTGRLTDARRLEKEIQNLALTHYTKDVDCQIAEWFGVVEMPDEAERALDNAVKKNPDVKLQAADILVRLARRLNDPALRSRAAARYLAALDALEKEHPDDRSVPTQRAWFLLREGTSLDAVAATAQKGLTEDPDDVASLRLLGWAKYRQGDAAGALTHFQRADELLVASGREIDLDTAYGLGLSLAKLQRSDDAKPWLRRALAIDGNYPEAKEAKALLE